MTTDTLHYVTLHTPAALAKQTEKFINCLDVKPKAGQGPELVSLVNLISKELTTYFLVEPAALAELTPMQMKVIDFCTATSAKVCGMVSSKLYKKCDNNEIGKIINYVQSIYTQIEGGSSCIAFSVDSEFAAKVQPLIDANNAGETLDGNKVVEMIDALTQEIMQQVFLRPTELIHLSMMTKKILNVGVDSCEKALHAVNDKVVKKLNNEQLKIYTNHYTAVLKTVTKEDAVLYA